MPLLAQVPTINSGGVVNAASWSSPAAPGSIVSIFGTSLATQVLSATPPLPKILGGTSVLINGVQAPLFFVSPGQINAEVPASLPAPGGKQISLTSIPVVVTTAAGSGTGSVALAAGAPGIFTADSSGCGQASALNIKPDGSVSVNSPSNSAAPGDFIALFGTGFGLALQQPADGSATPVPSDLQNTAGLELDESPSPVPLSYAGLAPGLVGVNQINFLIPASTRNGCAVPVEGYQTLTSSLVTISVQQGGGQCVNPPIQSWGQMFLTKFFTSDPFFGNSTSESFSAIFPAGPSIHPGGISAPTVFAPNWETLTNIGEFVYSSVPVTYHSCSVPGYSNLSAGTIRIQSPSGNAVIAAPNTSADGGISYSATLPDGFIGSGNYAISGTPGNDITLSTSLHAGSPIQLVTTFSAGTPISLSHPFTIQWTGGDAGSLVRVELFSQSSSGPEAIDSYADAGSGSLTISPCNGGSGSGCSFGLSPSSNASVFVDVFPNPAVSTSVMVPGVTSPVQFTWEYFYNFSGIALTQ